VAIEATVGWAKARLRAVPIIHSEFISRVDLVGTAQMRLCPAYAYRFYLPVVDQTKE
jgi:hypothetical protein